MKLSSNGKRLILLIFQPEGNDFLFELCTIIYNNNGFIDWENVEQSYNQRSRFQTNIYELQNRYKFICSILNRFNLLMEEIFEILKEKNF
jgi:hypothetical protein